MNTIVWPSRHHDTDTRVVVGETSHRQVADFFKYGVSIDVKDDNLYRELVGKRKAKAVEEAKRG